MSHTGHGGTSTGVCPVGERNEIDAAWVAAAKRSRKTQPFGSSRCGTGGWKGVRGQEPIRPSLLSRPEPAAESRLAFRAVLDANGTLVRSVKPGFHVGLGDHKPIAREGLEPRRGKGRG